MPITMTQAEVNSLHEFNPAQRATFLRVHGATEAEITEINEGITMMLPQPANRDERRHGVPSPLSKMRSSIPRFFGHR